MEKSHQPKPLRTVFPTNPDQPASTLRALHLDVAHYQTYLEGAVLDEVEKRNLIEAM